MKKPVAIRSHFYPENVYGTAWHRKRPKNVLLGWIVGRAGDRMHGALQQMAHAPLVYRRDYRQKSSPLSCESVFHFEGEDLMISPLSHSHCY
jgi:hypothetical protein